MTLEQAQDALNLCLCGSKPTVRVPWHSDRRSLVIVECFCGKCTTGTSLMDAVQDWNRANNREAAR